MSKFRTLKLTHDEVELITTALGIAEKQYSELHVQLTRLINVRGGNLTANESFHQVSCKFANLNNDIEKSKKDV